MIYFDLFFFMEQWYAAAVHLPFSVSILLPFFFWYSLLPRTLRDIPNLCGILYPVRCFHGDISLTSSILRRPRRWAHEWVNGWMLGNIKRVKKKKGIDKNRERTKRRNVFRIYEKFLPTGAFISKRIGEKKENPKKWWEIYGMKITYMEEKEWVWCMMGMAEVHPRGVVRDASSRSVDSCVADSVLVETTLLFHSLFLLFSFFSFLFFLHVSFSHSHRGPDRLPCGVELMRI